MIWFAPINPVLSPAPPQARALSDLFVVTLVVCAVTACVERFSQGIIAVKSTKSIPDYGGVMP